MGTRVRINPIHYMITRGALGNSGKRHHIITRAAVGNSGKRHYIITRAAIGNIGKKLSSQRAAAGNSGKRHPIITRAAVRNSGNVSHQWCEHFYPLLYSSPRHRERWKEEKETSN